MQASSRNHPVCYFVSVHANYQHGGSELAESLKRTYVRLFKTFGYFKREIQLGVFPFETTKCLELMHLCAY